MWLVISINMNHMKKETKCGGYFIFFGGEGEVFFLRSMIKCNITYRNYLDNSLAKVWILMCCKYDCDRSCIFNGVHGHLLAFTTSKRNA